MPMTETEAIALAAEWGSYIRSGDPGACMYGFSPEIGLKVQSEDHRQRCLDWIEHCKMQVEQDTEYESEDEAHAEYERLEELAQMIHEAPLDEG